ncbi:MAG: hypothetical protein AB7S93_06830 [Xanthobacteraceae bacterium]|jgi:ABC-type Fe2+-enterobactin transport system substrate-binding protein
MATGPSSATEQREQKEANKLPTVVVDFDEPQSSVLVKRLRKGKGKLMTRVERIVSELVANGTVKSTAQPVVIVLREIPSPFWLADEDDDDDED